MTDEHKTQEHDCPERTSWFLCGVCEGLRSESRSTMSKYQELSQINFGLRLHKALLDSFIERLTVQDVKDVLTRFGWIERYASHDVSEWVSTKDTYVIVPLQESWADFRPLVRRVIEAVLRET